MAKVKKEKNRQRKTNNIKNHNFSKYFTAKSAYLLKNQTYFCNFYNRTEFGFFQLFPGKNQADLQKILHIQNMQNSGGNL